MADPLGSKAKKKQKLDEAFLLSRGQSIYSASVNFRSDKIVERWKKDNDLYDSKFSDNPREREKSDVLVGQGRLFIPKTYSHTQRMLVDIMDTLFFDREEIVSVGTWSSVTPEDKEIVKTLLNYRLNGHPINFYAEAYEASLDALKNKIGIFKVYPEVRTMKFKAGDEDLELIESFTPHIDCLPYEDVFFDVRATWKNYFKYPIIHRMLKNKDYLKRKGYKNIDDIPTVAFPQSTTDEIKMQRSGDTGYPFTFTQDVEQAKDVMVFEFWDFLDVNNDGFLESCSYLCAGDLGGPIRLIRDVEENTLPYKIPGEEYNRPPILVGHAFPEPHKMYGKSLPEITEGLQRETNAQRNQRREAVALALRKPLLVNRSAGVDLTSLVNRRIGGVVLGDDISDQSVRELQVSDPTSTSIQEQAKTDQDFYETTSIPPNMLGMPTSNDETATATTAHIANANKKIQMVILNLAMTLFLPSFQYLLRLEQEYETDEFVAQVTGKVLGWKFPHDGFPPRISILGEFPLIVNLGVNKQMQINKWFLLMDRGTQANQQLALLVQSGIAKPQDVKFFNPMTAFEKILPILNEKNVEPYFIQAQPPPMPMEGAGAPSLARQAEGPVEGAVTNMNAEGVLSGLG